MHFHFLLCFLLLASSFEGLTTDFPQDCLSNYNAPYEEQGALQGRISGSFTYWQPLAEGLEVGLISANASSFTPSSKSRVVQTDFSYEPGLKLSLGLGGFPDHWEMLLGYTYFRSSSSTKTSVSSQQGIYTNRFQEANAVFAKSLFSLWKMRLEFLDPALSRTFYVGRHLLFTPSLGGRAYFLRHELKTQYQGGEITANHGEASQEAKSRSWGLGPKMGLHTHWLLPAGFSCEGGLFYSMAFTRYHIEIEETPTSTNAPFVFDQVNRTFRPMYDLNFGIEWSSSFPGSYVQCGFSLLYEFCVLKNQNVLSNVLSSPQSRPFSSLNDLYLHGLTLSGIAKF